MTQAESSCCSLISDHWGKTCAPRHPQLESCLDSAYKVRKKKIYIYIIYINSDSPKKVEDILYLLKSSSFASESPFALPTE